MAYLCVFLNICIVQLVQFSCKIVKQGYKFFNNIFYIINTCIMKVFTKISMAATLITFGALGFTGITMAATTPSLGMATSYGALSTTLTVTSSFVTINGSIGYSTLSSIYPLGVHLYS